MPASSTVHPRRLWQNASLVGWLGLLVAASLPGCTPPQRPPVAATGQRVVTGSVPFDRFFAESNDAWHAVETAQRELPDARAALARRLGLPEDAASDVLGARLRDRTARLAQEGLTLELEFTGIEADAAEDSAAPEAEAAGERASAIPSRPPATPTATLRTPGREPEARELRVLEVLAQAALSAALTYAEMSSVQRRIQPLRESVAPLRGQLEATFADASQRARVQQELSDADAQLEPLHERARGVANDADTLISILDEGANTVGTTARRRPLRDAPPRDPAGRPPVPRDAPAPSDRPARPAAAKPSLPAEGARDFEP
ncbi:MAG: hypothetical protein RL033_7135 [Pseudomonadota bacterium]|jgi:hypothetical protein